MHFANTIFRIYVGKALLLIFTFNSLVCLNLTFPQKISAQSRPIVITADQPNVWTLEQAHYLLAQMHRRNLDLKAQRMDKLDPNAINGTNIDLLRTMFEFNAVYNQVKGFENELLAENKEFNSKRRQQLITQRDRLNEENLALVRDIAKLENQLKRASETEKAQINADLDEKKANQAGVKELITQTDNELKTLNAPSGDLKDTSATAPTSTKLPDATLKAALDKAITAMDNKPSLNASLQLSNFLDLQYEILAKQLSLLRDEVGPGERLLFLEIPQSINSTRGKADKKWAQTWFKIAGYTVAEQNRQNTTDAKQPGDGKNLQIYKTLSPAPSPAANPIPSPSPCPTLESEDSETPKSGHSSEITTISDTVESILGRDESNVRCVLSKFDENETIKKQISEAEQQLKQEEKEQRKTTLADQLKSLKEKNTALENELKRIDAGLNIAPEDVYNIPDLVAKLKAENPTAADAYALENIPANEIVQLNNFEQSMKKNEVISRSVTDDIKGVFINLFNNSAEFRPEALYSAKRFESVAMSMETNKLRLANSPVEFKQKLLRRLLIEAMYPNEIAPFHYSGCRSNSSRFINLDVKRPIQGLNRNVSNRLVRVVDVVPRQSSLNVNDVKLRTNESYFGVALSLLFGFGASAKYKREREQFSQFVQQELYSSGFGKGSREFGWTYTPMPGASRLMPGVRTTYAIIVVPREANSLILESSGCYFPRSQYQPRDFANTQDDGVWRDEEDDDDQMCTKSDSLIVVVPHSGIDKKVFSVDSIEYKAVEQNQRATVTIRGHNFPTQIGVLVGGTPLVQAIGLAQPLIYDDSDVRSKIDNGISGSAIKGEFERLSDEQVTFWFQMPKDYQGTPPISLVAPGETKQLNYLNGVKVIADGVRPVDEKSYIGESVCKQPDNKLYSLKEYSKLAVLNDAPYMFGKRTELGGKINSVNAFKADDDAVVVYVLGENFKADSDAKLYVNGKEPEQLVFKNEKYWSVKVKPSKSEESLHVTIANKKEALTYQPVKNPIYKAKEPEQPSSKPEILAITEPPKFYEFVPETEHQPARLTVELSGFGFNDELKVEPATTASLIVENENKAYLTLIAPPPFVKVKLTNAEKKAFATVIVKRKQLLESKISRPKIKPRPKKRRR